MDLAEGMIRERGYNGFSFREIAKVVGIKSASVHHHFPTKDSLALAAARRYIEEFFRVLGPPKRKDQDVEEIAKHYASVFQEAFRRSGKACLCGMLARGASTLSDELRSEVESFVERNINWLTEALQRPGENRETSAQRAQMVYVALEGAMGLAALTQDQTWIDSVAETIVRTIKGS
ncbi:MAG: TetR/AcrR family transcriptional regulator [Verrucomicrobiota bacterium]